MKTAANTADSPHFCITSSLGSGSVAWLRGVALAVALAPAASGAQGFAGSLGMGTDNVYRGISLTSGKPAWLFDLHYASGNEWLVGIGASAERPAGQSAAAQLTAYVDRIWQLDEDWTTKLGLIHYESPWNFWRKELSSTELNAAIGYRGRWRAAIAVSPDSPHFDPQVGLLSGVTVSSELAFHQAIAGRLAADIGLGYTNMHASDLDYAYGSVGLSYGIGDVHVYSSLLWINSSTQPYALEKKSCRRWVTSLVWSF